MSKNNNKSPRVRVAGMIIHKDKLLLVKHVRDGDAYYLLPGGGLEWGETCEQGLIREFEEELSLSIKVGQLIAVNESISPDNKRHIVHLTFKAFLKGKQRLKVNHDKRLKGADWVDQKQFKSILFYPEIRTHLFNIWQKKSKGGMNIIKTPWS